MENNLKKKIVILGAGITGLILAKELSQKYKDKVVVLEKENYLGGLISTLSAGDLSFDLGSHRLHRDASPRIIKYIEESVGEKLLKRPRRGKLYFQGKFIDYPPHLYGLLKDLSFQKFTEFCVSYLKTFVSPSIVKGKNFEEAMIKKAGKKNYEIFYKDYAKKLWGKDPKQISTDSSRKRRIFESIGSLTKSLFTKNDYFFYPRRGIGEIAKSLEDKITNNNGRVIKAVEIKKVFLNNSRVSGITIEDSQGSEIDIDLSILISTIPADELFGLLFEKESAKDSLEWRGLRLLYILIEENIKCESETYYFPSLDVILGRVSEIRKYSPYLNSSIKETLLTIEIPSSAGDDIWDMEESRLLNLCLRDLIKVKILEKYPKFVKHFSLKLEKAYPVYGLGWEKKFFKIYNKLSKIGNLFTVGRRGLFLHCNIDHCIIQGLELADLILKGKWYDKDLWNKKVLQFLKFSARD